MEKFIVLLGTAGAGKSVLASLLKERIESFGASTIIVNLDPAVKKTPYEPNIDARNYVSYDQILSTGLGPNASLIASVDSLVLHVTEIREEIYSFKADYVIIDTPGQMEVFAYRIGGPMLIKTIIEDNPATTVFLIDALFFEDPLSIVSALSLASSIAFRFMYPQINVVSKSDILLPEIVSEVLERLTEEGFLESLIAKNTETPENTKYMAQGIVKVLYDAGFIGDLLPISAYDIESIDKLYGRIQQVLSGGEDYAVYR